MSWWSRRKQKQGSGHKVYLSSFKHLPVSQYDEFIQGLVNPFTRSEPYECNHFLKTYQLATKASIKSLWGAEQSQGEGWLCSLHNYAEQQFARKSTHIPCLSPSSLPSSILMYASSNQRGKSPVPPLPAPTPLPITNPTPVPPGHPWCPLQAFAFTSFVFSLITDSSLGSSLPPTAGWQIPSKIVPVTHQWILFSLVCPCLPTPKGHKEFHRYCLFLKPDHLKKDCLAWGNKNVAWALSELPAYRADTL